MASDADSYESLLRLLGFSVTTVVSENKVNFALRWPVRDYTVVSGRFVPLDNGRCEIKGVVSWRATRPPSKPVKGMSDFDFIISLDRNPVIVSETSKVLSKDP